VSLQMISLHRKITFSYSLLAGLIFLLSIFAFADLLFLESKIDEGRVVSVLKDDVFEMRRYEKNLLLYRKRDDLNQIQDFISRVQDNLQSNKNLFISLLSEVDVKQLFAALQQYAQLFSDQERVLTVKANTEANLARDIRKQGHIISTTVTRFELQERQVLAAMANSSQWALAGAILVMGMLAIAIGWRMARVVVKPLKQIEKKLVYIANGRFDYLKPVSQDEEYVTFTNALNRMLHELDLRHRRMLQAEKLASLGVLVSGVAHELNNPLGNISSSCQLLVEELDDADTAQQKEWLQQIDDETDRARNIVSALLEYGQKRAFELESLLLSDVIEKSLLLLRNQLKHATSLQLDIPDGFRIRADMQRMQQVFINLIRNALLAGGDDVEIKIQAKPGGEFEVGQLEEMHFVGDASCILNQQALYCEILIADNGPGISDTVIEKIFDPFFTTSEPGHGSGLGLFIVQEIIQEHDGCIGVYSKADEGTQFIIRLPCAGAN